MKSFGKWAVVIPASVLLIATACSSSSSSTNPAVTTNPAEPAAGTGDVSVTLNQWSITPDITTVPSGSVNFMVRNDGTIPHEFVVLSTDTQAADLPIVSFEGEANRIDEAAKGVKNVGETGDMEAATTKTLTVTLAPGHYAFVCNLPAHFGQGMHVDFTVT